MVRRTLALAVALVVVVQVPSYAFVVDGSPASLPFVSSEEERFKLWQHYNTKPNRTPLFALRPSAIAGGAVGVFVAAAPTIWAAAAELARTIYPLPSGSEFTDVPRIRLQGNAQYVVLPARVPMTPEQLTPKLNCWYGVVDPSTIYPGGWSGIQGGYYSVGPYYNYETTNCGGIFQAPASGNGSTSEQVVFVAAGTRYKTFRGYAGLVNRGNGYSNYGVGTVVMDFTPRATALYPPLDSEASHWVSSEGTKEIGYPEGTATATTPAPSDLVAYYDPGSNSVVDVPYSSLPSVLPTYPPSAAPSSAPTVTPSTAPSATATPVPGGGGSVPPSGSSAPSPSSTPPQAAVAWLSDVVGEPCPDNGASPTLGYWVLEGKSYEGVSMSRWVDLEWTRPIWAAGFLLAGLGLLVAAVITL